MSALRGVSAPGGCLLPGGVVSQHALRQTPPPPCGQTDACKNITFATSLQTVIKMTLLQQQSIPVGCVPPYVLRGAGMVLERYDPGRVGYGP